MPLTTYRLCWPVVALLLLAFPALSCGDSHDVCRFEPERCTNGEAGAFCDTDRDCIGVCCKEKANCASGMCTYPCADDRDCPVDMACEHSVCFYLCDTEADCAIGQRCEHNHTVCEWP